MNASLTNPRLRRVYTGLTCLLVLPLVATSAAHADVLAKSESGFIIDIQVPIAAAPDEVFERLGEVESWWSPNHTYTLDAKNLYLERKPHGWFGERLPDGGFVRHLEVVFLQPRLRTIRLAGGLGPLQELGISGTMKWKVVETEQGSQFELRYHVSGYLPNGLGPLAATVNQVLTEQAERLREACEEK